MKRLPLLVLSGIAAAGCGSPDLNSESDFVELFNGAVSVRKQDSVHDIREFQLEIVANEPGWIRIGYGPDGVSTSFLVSEADRHLLRVVNEEIEAKAVIDTYLTPLLGRETADELRFSSPEVLDKKLLYTTIFTESLVSPGKSSMGPFVTPAPTSHGDSMFSYTVDDKSSSIDGPVRLAGWLYMAAPGVRPGATSWTIYRDMVGLAISGIPVEFDGVAALFRELTIEYSPEPLTGPAEHACAVANRRCPAGL